MAKEPARVAETHISVLFFVGDRVYKLRKPVKFGFLDFRERKEREADCRREVVLNRRLAPDVYLGVADVVVDGEPIDHMVVMRRMPDERRLATLVRHGADLSDWLRQVAEAMATFHATAERSSEISAAATAESLQADWEANFTEVGTFVGSLLDEDCETEIRSLVRRWFAGRALLFESRIDSGHVCDGHGDLQAEDIFCLDDGIRILDCIEFSDRLRHCDVCADVAFLAMDLERLDHPDDAKRFILRYEDATGEQFPPALLHHYCASRAYVRAKVACLRVAQGGDDARVEAGLLQSVALDHLRQARVRLVIVGGAPGSGKSTLAAGIADARQWTILRSDEIRKELEFGGGDGGYQMGRYSPAATARVYEEMLERAGCSLELGESVILDASWVDAGWRARAREVAERTSSDLSELRCVVDPAEAADRIVRRLTDHADVSEATPEIAEEMSRSMDAWESAEVIDTSGRSPTQGILLALEAIDR